MKNKMEVKESKIHNHHKGSVYLWCLHCERTYRRGEYIEADGLQMCPYPDCNGNTVMDAVPWGTIRSASPEYPVIPERGMPYPDRRGPDCRCDEMPSEKMLMKYMIQKVVNDKTGESGFFGFDDINE